MNLGMQQPQRSCQMVQVDTTLDVRRRLMVLQKNVELWRQQDADLKTQVMGLNPSKRADVLRGTQIASVRRQLALSVTLQPLMLDPAVVQQAGYGNVRRHLKQQYHQLTTPECSLWLSNLAFLLTPSLEQAMSKLDAIRHYRRLGQQRCFLLGGVSGVGKSSLLNWYAVSNLPKVEAERNHIPVIKIDAPVNNRSPKPLFQRLLLACGAVTIRGDEEYYLHLLTLYFQQCGVELLIIDEVEHITSPSLRRRLLELSNLTGIPIVCASCHPISWTNGDSEIQGRWNDYFEVKQLTGQRLDAFLSLLELLLPFDTDAFLGVREIQGKDGPAALIERWTDGIMRDIMMLVLDASHKALAAPERRLTIQILEQAWRAIKHTKVVNFLEHWYAHQGGA